MYVMKTGAAVTTPTDEQSLSLSLEDEQSLSLSLEDEQSLSLEDDK